METGYTVKENKHTSLLDDGFMPVETVLEVPVQEQAKTKIIKGEIVETEIFSIGANEDLKFNIKQHYLSKLKGSSCCDAYDTVVILSKYSQDEVIRLNHSISEFLANIENKQIQISDLKDIRIAITENLNQADEFSIKVISELIESYKKQKITANKIKEIYNISFAIIIQKKLFNFDANN